MPSCLQVNTYNGKPQLVAKIHRAKECSFCLFDGRQEVCCCHLCIAELNIVLCAECGTTSGNMLHQIQCRVAIHLIR